MFLKNYFLKEKIKQNSYFIWNSQKKNIQTITLKIVEERSVGPGYFFNEFLNTYALLGVCAKN